MKHTKQKTAHLLYLQNERRRSVFETGFKPVLFLYFRVVTWSGPQRKRVMSDIEIDGNETVEQIEQKFDEKQKEVTKT